MRKILVALVLLAALVAPAAPAEAQDWFEIFDSLTEPDREAGMRLKVWDPTVEDDLGNTVGGYVVLRLETLLAGLVTFPDTYTRYVFQLEWPGSTPTVDATDIQGGTASAAGALAIQFPAPPAGAALVAIGFAVPEDADAPTYTAIGTANSGLNGIHNYAQQSGTIDLTVNGAVLAYDVWVSAVGYFPVFSSSYLFLDQNAAP